MEGDFKDNVRDLPMAEVRDFRSVTTRSRQEAVMSQSEEKSGERTGRR